jgi:hypothetical protein
MVIPWSMNDIKALIFHSHGRRWSLKGKKYSVNLIFRVFVIIHTHYPVRTHALHKYRRYPKLLVVPRLNLDPLVKRAKASV